jgi:hypothetical protein
METRGLVTALADLRVEEKRPSPHVDAFVIRAETMLGTLASD